MYVHICKLLLLFVLVFNTNHMPLLSQPGHSFLCFNIAVFYHDESWFCSSILQGFVRLPEGTPNLGMLQSFKSLASGP